MTKKIFFIALSFISSISIAQVSEIRNSITSENGEPELIILNEYEIANINLLQSTLTTTPAGDAIEGDFLGEMKFTPNGEEIWVLNRTTNNITVIDWDTQEITQNIPVGISPIGIDFSSDYAVVACFGSNDVYIIDVNDYTVQTNIAISQGPSKVHISNNGNVAVVGCDTSDTAEVIDLTTLTNTLTIPNFPVSITAVSFITNNTRNLFNTSNFRVTPDGLFVANGTSSDGLKFWNLSTGAVVTTITEAANTTMVELSIDGTKLIAVRNGTDGTAYQIDVSTQTLLKEVTATGENVQNSFSAPAVNADGSKIISPSYTSNIVLFDMDTESFQGISTGNSPSWVGVNSTGDTFVAGSYYLATIDANTGTVLDTSTEFPISVGAVGLNNRIVAASPLRYEGVLTRSFLDPTNIISEGISPTGSTLEADVCYYMKFTPNEEKLLSINNISGTVSVIDIETETLESIIPLNTYNISSCDITSDSNYAVIAKRQENKVAIIDLQTNLVVADLPSGGSGPSQVFVLPGNQYAYVLNGSGSDRIGVIELNGASSSLASSFIIGNVGTSFTNFGIQSGLEFTEDGQFGLLASSFTDEVEIIDLIAHEIVTTISTPGFPLQIALSTHNGNEYAAVTLKGASGKIAILQRSGSDWSLQGTYNCASEPVRVDYDETTNSFWVTSSQDKKTQQFSLDSFSFINEISFSPSEPIAVRNARIGNRRFDLVNDYSNPSNNKLFVTTDGTTESFELPAISSHNFDITETGSYAAVGHWGIDQITIFEDELLGTRSFTIDMKSPYILYPNPIDATINFHKIDGSTIENKEFRIIDLNGKLIFNQAIDASSSFSIKKPASLQSGIYIYQIYVANKLIQTGKLISE